MLETIDGEIVFDIDSTVSGVAEAVMFCDDDVSADDSRLRARAMSYLLAAFEIRAGGAAVGIRPRLLDGRAETVARFSEEVSALVDSGTLIVDRVPDADALDRRALGTGVVAAASGWLGGLAGRSVAIEDVGSVGIEVAVAADAAGASVLGVSTTAGAIAVGAGFDIDDLVAASAEHGDAFVRHLGPDVHPPGDLHRLAVDVLVPGPAVGIYTAEVAARVQADVVAPAGLVPYTAAGLEALRSGGTVPLPDFVTSAGAAIARHAPKGLPDGEILRRVERLVADRVTSARMARLDPFDHAALLADTFFSTWIPAEHRPDGPALADG